MSLRWRLILLLLPLTIMSFLIIDRLEKEREGAPGSKAVIPDFTMTGVDTLNMDLNGNPETRLTAAAMAHYEQRGETELTRPRLKLFRDGEPPLYVAADQGWVASENEVILLQGNVRFWEPGADNEAVFEITTSKATIYPNRNMAETDQAATLTTPDSVTHSVGLRAWLGDDRIEMLHQVKTIIKPDRVRIDPTG